MPRFFRSIASALTKRRRRDRSDSHTSPTHRSTTSTESGVEKFARAIIRVMAPTAGLLDFSIAEIIAAGARHADRSTNASSTYQATTDSSKATSEDRRDCNCKTRTSASLAEVHSVDEEFDEELAALARLRVDALRYLNSPLGKERDPDGYVTLLEYQPHVRHRLVKIETLSNIDQNCHYEHALYGATTSQVQNQYELHCQRLEAIRTNVPTTQQGPKRERRLGNIDYEAWCCMSSRLMMNRLVALAERAWEALIEADKWYEERLCSRIAENGVIRLLERCEGILKKADRGFISRAWQPVRSGLKKRRWAGGKRGWTGLDL